jgi:adenylate cyclase
MTADKPTPQAIKAQLERILQSTEFRASDKQMQFLGFVVEETLQSRAAQLKGYTIAVAVYGRSESFDPQIDPIVRVEAGRLRRALAHYYLKAGRYDPVHIEIPKGGYIPTFHSARTPPSGERAHTSKNRRTALPPEPSIAVMPLIDLAGNKEQEYFAEGLTEELTTELARYQDIRVIASQSTMPFKNREVDPKVIGRDLGVRFLLMGSVRKDSITVKVSIRLIDTTSAEQIWGKSYKRDQTAADIIAVQEEISQSAIGLIADQYGLINRGMSKESRKKAPTDLKAYDATLQFYRYESELTPAAFKKAFTSLEQAIQIDPEYGLAWSMLGHLHADNYALGFCEIETPLEKALTFAQKGMALAPENQFAWDALTLVYFHRGEKETFLRHAAKTIALNPNSPYIIGVAGWHMMLYGEWDRGHALLKKGMTLNPYHPSWFHLAPFMEHYHRGDYENAYAAALKFNFPKLYLDPMMRAAALAQLEWEDHARAAVGKLLELEPDFATHGRSLMSRYVKVDGLIDRIFEGLQKAGLTDIE